MGNLQVIKEEFYTAKAIKAEAFKAAKKTNFPEDWKIYRSACRLYSVVRNVGLGTAADRIKAVDEFNAAVEKEEAAKAARAKRDKDLARRAQSLKEAKKAQQITLAYAKYRGSDSDIKEALELRDPVLAAALPPDFFPFIKKLRITKEKAFAWAKFRQRPGDWKELRRASRALDHAMGTIGPVIFALRGIGVTYPSS